MLVCAGNAQTLHKSRFSHAAGELGCVSFTRCVCLVPAEQIRWMKVFLAGRVDMRERSGEEFLRADIRKKHG